MRVDLFEPCRFCGDQPGGCLVCIPLRIKARLEIQAAEHAALAALIQTPEFQAILEAHQRALELSRPARPGSETGRGCLEIFDYIELTRDAPLDGDDIVRCYRNEQEYNAAMKQLQSKRKRPVARRKKTG